MKGPCAPPGTRFSESVALRKSGRLWNHSCPQTVSSQLLSQRLCHLASRRLRGEVARRGQSVGERLKGHEGSPGLKWVYPHSDNHCEGQKDNYGNYEEQRIVSPCLEQEKLRGAGCRCLIIDPRQFLGVGGRL